jgi:hypothetical protein
VLSDAQINDWGWRVAFAGGLLIVTWLIESEALLPAGYFGLLVEPA